MRTKKYVIALAIFGGMLFTTYAATSISQDAQETAIKKGPFRIPSAG
ncbi:hypothetical protein [Algibacter mikhailovii]|uniref:Uncharacterized protein n=1 Tax=Algibacter mikhailovii TaxID=425498 RepID=A0A918QRD8_9FLAO|nr:hypothetical protein [Algibacter mikhailovii]GGZ69267.1 hypothetical protein GCM10007028_02820 [Algibacter mikhailovii]